MIKNILKKLENKVKNIDEDIKVVYEKENDFIKIIITKTTDDTNNKNLKKLEKEIKNVLGTKIFQYEVRSSRRFNYNVLTITTNFQTPYKLIEELNKKL